MIDLTIDAGHGGNDPGAVGPTGVREKDITLKLALKVGNLLTSRGVNVNYTRMDDRSVELSERAAFANAAKARYFLSIHINSAANAAANGTETYAFAPGGQGEKLAAAVQKNLVTAIGLTNRGVKFANYAVLRETNMPAALTEVNFICNPKEEAILKDEAFLNKAASGIAKGVIEFLGLKWEESQAADQGATDSSNVPQWQKDAFKKLVEKKIINSPEFWEGRLGETITIGEVMGILANTL